MKWFFISMAFILKMINNNKLLLLSCLPVQLVNFLEINHTLSSALQNTLQGDPRELITSLKYHGIRMYKLIENTHDCSLENQAKFLPDNKMQW